MTDFVNIVGFVFARGGSKGVPNKNLRLLGGKPLIGHAIEAALQSRSLNRVVVSTDSLEIARVARSYGAEVPFMRPPEQASDDAPERLAWRHAIEQIEQIDGSRIDFFVSIPPTCPLRSSSDIDNAVQALADGDGDIVLSATEASCNPYFNMITIAKNGAAMLAATPESDVSRRQDAPKVYELTAVAYAARRDSIFKFDSIFECDARAIEVPVERAVDIDTEFDLKLAEFLYSQRTHQEVTRAA